MVTSNLAQGVRHREERGDRTPVGQQAPEGWQAGPGLPVSIATRGWWVESGPGGRAGVKVSRIRQRLRRAGDLRVPARERTPLHLPVCGRLGTASTGQLGRRVRLACAGRWHTGWTGRSRRGASQSPRRKGQGAEKKSLCASGKELLVQNRGRKNTEMLARAGHQTPQRPELPRHGSARCLRPKKPHTKKREVPSFVAFVMGRGQFTRPDFGA